MNIQKSKLYTFYDHIDAQGKRLKNKPCLLHEDIVVTYEEFNHACSRAANGLVAQGGKPGDGVALLMANCPEYLYLFYGLPRAGFYTVPVNIALKKDGLRFILTDSEVKYLVVDDVLYPKVAELKKPVGKIEKVFVRRTVSGPVLSGEKVDLDTLMDASFEKPDYTLDPEDIVFLLYTSGTTGFPKGVIYRAKGWDAESPIAFAKLLLNDDDIPYTALPLFHGNAIGWSVRLSLALGLTFAVDKRFSASRFWDSIRRYQATQFNAIGSVMQILMKQPERPDDAENPVRMVLSMGMPRDLWDAFEKRFNLTIYEAYGAVDGGGIFTLNTGTSPKGSIGKVTGDLQWKLVDNNGNEVGPGVPGELVHKARTPGGENDVQYFKNPEATKKKVRNGWIYSGDLLIKDKEGNLYFSDRKTDSMRRRGENISSFEVENIVTKYPSIAECAAFGVPSEIGEDDVMIWVKPKSTNKLDLKDLIRFCAENMAYFMVPRYVDIVEKIPKTETMKIMKIELKKRGVTERTWDREKEMPELKLQKI